MMNTRVETKTETELSLGSEDRSRGFGRNHRLLTILAAGFVFLALCLMTVDVRRLDHAAPRHAIHSGHVIHQARVVKLVR
jgi:hypothetical protein